MNELMKAIDEMKSEPPDINAITGLSLEVVIQGVSAWPYSDSSMDVEGIESVSTDTAKRWEWIWGGVKFDPDKWMSMMDGVPPRGLMVRLILAGLIYPDGTVNVDWLDTARMRLRADQQRSKQGGR